MPNNAQARQAFSLFICSFFEAFLLLPMMKQKCFSGGRVQKGLYVRAGENADLLFSLAVTSATKALNPPFLCSWQLLPTLLYIRVGLNQCAHKAHQGLASSCRCKILHFTPRVTRQSQPRVRFGLGQAGESSYPASCLKTVRLEPSSDQHIVHQNQEVQKGLLALESRERNPAIKSAFPWFLLSSSVITQL